MLLLSAAEAVDQSEGLVTINVHLFCGRCDLAQIWLLAKAICQMQFLVIQDILTDHWEAAERQESMSCNH